jgi:hypothetical protein
MQAERFRAKHALGLDPGMDPGSREKREPRYFVSVSATACQI